MSVWVLMLVAIKTSTPDLVHKNVDITMDSAVFKDAATCLRFVDKAKDIYKSYDSVTVNCSERHLK